MHRPSARTGNVPMQRAAAHPSPAAILRRGRASFVASRIPSASGGPFRSTREDSAVATRSTMSLAWIATRTDLPPVHEEKRSCRAAIVRSAYRIHVGLSTHSADRPGYFHRRRERTLTRASRPVANRCISCLARTCAEAGEMHRYLSEPGRVPKDEERSSSEKVRRTI